VRTEDDAAPVPHPGQRDPWPSAHPYWSDPPWLVSGRAVTAWFDVPWEIVERVMSPDLLPEPTPSIRTRLRFYDLAFKALGEAPGRTAVESKGRFREGVVGFPARYRDLKGESSQFIWSDSELYMLWSREAFGWPVRLGSIDLDGSVWTDEKLEGSSGMARVEDRWGSASLRDIKVGAQSEGPAPSGYWLTPRRHLVRGGLGGETRDLLIVRPTLRKAGVHYSATGRVEFEFPAPHPLQSFPNQAAIVHIADGFELVFAEDVAFA
jgi:hypothetical protein